jgi:antitoxin component of MazEF toxin-antitoxin module
LALTQQPWFTSRSDYTDFLPASRLVRIGNSLGVIVPKRNLDSMGWWQSDILHQEVKDGQLVIRNMTQRPLQPMHTKHQYGDAVSRKT